MFWHKSEFKKLTELILERDEKIGELIKKVDILIDQTYTDKDRTLQNLEKLLTIKHKT